MAFIEHNKYTES